jgi:hypothetical protein
MVKHLKPEYLYVKVNPKTQQQENKHPDKKQTKGSNRHVMKEDIWIVIKQNETCLT